MSKWTPPFMASGFLLLNSILLLIVIVLLLTGKPSIHRTNLPLSEDFQTLSLEDLAMRFQYADIYPEKQSYDTRTMALAEMVRRNALHKGLLKREVMFLLGAPYNLHNPDDGSLAGSNPPNDWRYSCGVGTLTVNFDGGKLTSVVQGHDGDNLNDHDETLIK